MSNSRQVIWGLIALAAAALCGGIQPAAADLAEQRSAFRDAWAAAELGDWRPAAANASILEDYVLWPDLRAAWLRTRLHAGEGREVEAFLQRYDTLKPARELRYRYALQLAADGRLADYLELYKRHYRNLGLAKLDCIALQAELLAAAQDGVASGLAARGRELWLVGESQVDECDPVFDYLRAAGLLDADLYRQRFELALSARQLSLARYLSRSLEERYLVDANAWLAARDQPEAFLQTHIAEGGASRPQLAFAVEQLAYRDALLADGYWRAIAGSEKFPREQEHELSRHVALWAARQHRPEARRMLHDLAPDAVDAEVTRWKARTALVEHDWAGVLAATDEMSEDERQTEEWRYWLAIALQASGESEAASARLEELAAERSYYGFLAADALGLPYAWSHAPLAGDEEILARLAAHPSLIRARELYHVGLEGRGRSEWDAAVQALQADEKLQAAILAHRWNWPSRAIATAASVANYDDLELRYPLPYREQFEKFSTLAQISNSWAYGIARSESLFMADVRSYAGAVGVMQLMPDSGRRAAAELGVGWSGLATLTDPQANIQLGTAWLGKMLRRFSDNRVLATAAYNAGPQRVERWLPESGSLDARIWIETIPFNETRSYVRRVLATDAIFYWRLTGETRRLSDDLTVIGPELTRQLADAGKEPGEDS